MFLLVRTPALALMLSLTAGLVAMATAQPGITCRQEIPAEMMRNLWNWTKDLIKKLPKDKGLSRRLLPSFTTQENEKHMIGWLEIQELIDVYQTSVFSNDNVQKLLPLHYNNLLYRLQHTLQHCVSSSEPSKWFKLIEKLKEKIKKRRRDEVTLKAIREFTYILRWINELAQHKAL